MTKNNSIIVGIGALLALGISVPLEWITIHNASLQPTGVFEELGNALSLPLGSITATGINGSFTFLIDTPIWLVVVVGMVGVLLGLLNCLGVASLPRVVPLALLSLPAAYVFASLVRAVGVPEATPEIGIFIALVGLVLGLVQALTYQGTGDGTGDQSTV